MSRIQFAKLVEAAQTEAKRLAAQTPEEIKTEAKANAKAKANEAKAKAKAKANQDLAIRNTVRGLWTSVNVFDPTTGEYNSLKAQDVYHLTRNVFFSLYRCEKFESDQSMAKEVCRHMRGMSQHITPVTIINSDRCYVSWEVGNDRTEQVYSLYIEMSNYAFEVSQVVNDVSGDHVSSEYIGRVFTMSNLRDAVAKWLGTITQVVV
jgi:5-methylthioribose kinase